MAVDTVAIIAAIVCSSCFYRECRLLIAWSHRGSVRVIAFGAP